MQTLPSEFQVKRIIWADFNLFVTISNWIFVRLTDIHSPHKLLTTTTLWQCQSFLMDLDPFLNVKFRACSELLCVFSC